MRRTRLARAAGAITASVLAIPLLAGCGSSSKSKATTGSKATTATTKPNLNGVTLAVDAEWSGDEQAAFQQVLAKFEQDTGAKITYTSTGDDVAAVLGTAIQGGKPPDVALLPQPGLLKELATKGSLVAVDDVVGKDVDANYAPVWRQLGTVDGKLYGVWFKAADKSTTWYNTKVFKDAGIEPPKTFDDLVKDVKTISDSGVTPISQGGADGWTLTDWFENIYLRQAGADKYDQLSTHAIPWTDPSVKKALTTMSQVLAPNFLTGGAAGALQTDFPTSVTNVFASPPKAAIVYEGDFVATNIKKETQAKLGVDADFFDFPSVDGSQPAVVGGGDVAVLMKDSPGGRALMQYLASPDSAGIWAKLGGFTSPNKKVDLATYPDDITRRTAKSITSTSQFRFDMSDLAPAAFGGTVGKGEWKILQDWLAHQDQVDQTTQQLEAAAKAAFGH